MNPDVDRCFETNAKKDGLIARLFKAFTFKGRTDLSAQAGRRETEEIFDCLKNAKAEWDEANMNFDYAEDKEIVDYYIYRMKACEVRYDYFLKKAKERTAKSEALHIDM
jgi:hypothetical protein